MDRSKRWGQKSMHKGIRKCDEDQEVDFNDERS
jgi:hypothetical protein